MRIRILKNCRVADRLMEPGYEVDSSMNLTTDTELEQLVADGLAEAITQKFKKEKPAAFEESVDKI